jgi:hypothetical protein
MDRVVIPTGASRSEAKWRDLFWCCVDKKRSLGCAALRAASLGMTGIVMPASLYITRVILSSYMI